MSVERSEFSIERSPRGAVFLSYAREDAAATRRIAEALRAGGVEVWFDEDELRGGDAWDAKIRKQIRECALFVPIISAHTQARNEGYFRLEWRLADRRTELMGKARAFLMPVCIDGTTEGAADVPDSFLAVQWTRLAGGETPPAFCARIQKLLDDSTAGTGRPHPVVHDGGGAAPTHSGQSTGQRRSLTVGRLTVVGLFLAAAIAVTLWQPWRSKARTPVDSSTTPSKPASEVARLRSKLIPYQWKKEDFDPWSAALDRIIAADDQNADAWALRSMINSLQVMRNFVADTKPLETGRTAANRALHLSPESPLAQLALGMHHAAMISRGGEAKAARPYLSRALDSLPNDALTRYADLTTAWLGFDFDEVERAAKTWLKAEPKARFPAYILAQAALVLRDPAEAIKWAEQAASDQDITGMRAYVVGFDAQYYLRADLVTARTMLDRIPTAARTAHRVMHARWLLAMAEGRSDLALQELARTPESIFYEGAFYGPKALLAGLAHQAAGRTEVALAQFREAERVLRDLLANDAQNEPLHAVLAVTLAHSGLPEKAREELALVEPLVRGRPRTMYSGRVMIVLAQAHAALDEVEPAIYWLRQLLSGPALTPVSPATLRLDPRFRGIVAKPEMQALLAEFGHLDTKAGSTARSDEKSIAVLAFKNLSEDKGNDVFSDGISDELANVLGRVPGLRVAGSTSAFSFKGKGATEQEIGQKLGVRYIVDGTVRKANGRVRITAKLIDGTTGFVIRTFEPVEHELKDVWTAQDEIVAQIATNLSVTLGSSIRVRKQVNPEAHAAVLEARHFFAPRSYEGFDRSEAAFQRALQIDPEFAEAHGGLGMMWVTRAGYSEIDGRPAGNLASRGVAAANRAIELDPKLPDGHQALGYAGLWAGNFAQAEKHLRTAVSLNPSSSDARHILGLVLSNMGRLEESIAEHQAAATLDPLGWMNLQNLARSLEWAQRYDEAYRLNERVAALREAAVFIPNRGEKAILELELGNAAAAADAARYLRANPDAYPRWQHDSAAVGVLWQTDHRQEALDFAAELFKKWPEDHYQRGFVLNALDRFDEALPHLERTPAQPVRYLYWDKRWDARRNDPRFIALIEKLGRTQEYEAARASLARLRPEQPTRK